MLAAEHPAVECTLCIPRAWNATAVDCVVVIRRDQLPNPHRNSLQKQFKDHGMGDVIIIGVQITSDRRAPHTSHPNTRNDFFAQRWHTLRLDGAAVPTFTWFFDWALPSAHAHHINGGILRPVLRAATANVPAYYECSEDCETVLGQAAGSLA
jgi:hypothetical protein